MTRGAIEPSIDLMERSYGREEKRPKEGPNFEISGKLYEENKRHGKALKHAEPSDAALPEQKWRFHVFKGDDQVEVIKLWGQSSFLFGRDSDVVDALIAHESCSKQHAVVQFRKVTKDLGFGNYQASIKYTFRIINIKY